MLKSTSYVPTLISYLENKMISLALEAGLENLSLNCQIFELFHFFFFWHHWIYTIAKDWPVFFRNCPPTSIQSTFAEYLLCTGTMPSHQHEESPEEKFVTRAGLPRNNLVPLCKRIIFLSRGIFLLPPAWLLSRLLAIL